MDKQWFNKKIKDLTLEDVELARKCGWNFIIEDGKVAKVTNPFVKFQLTPDNSLNDASALKGDNNG